MSAKYDIVISYSGSDNNITPEPRWVTEFSRFLDILVTQLLGRKPTIHLAAAELMADLPEATACICVLSPDYVNSVPCMKQAENYFRKLKETSGTLGPQGNPRIFKVLKYYVPTNQHPDGYKELIGYNLYAIDMTTGESVEVRDFFTSEADRAYWMRLADLAYDLYELFTSYSANSNNILPVHQENIYLANTTRELSIQRDVIRRELQRHGYNVFPKVSIPSDAPNLEKLVTDDLEKCKLSIHLLNGGSFKRAENAASTEKTLPELQNTIAAKYSEHKKSNGNGAAAQSSFSRLIWIPPDLRATDEQQRIFVENLKRDKEALAGADVVITPLEELKSIIRNELDQSSVSDNFVKEANNGQVDKDNSKFSIYLIYDKMDADEARKIVGHLSVSGYEVLLPDLKDNILQSRQFHHWNLNRCDAVLIFMGKVSEAWVRSKLHDLLKAPGFGRDRDFKSKGLYIDKGVVINDPFILSSDLVKIQNNGEFLSELLRPFIAKI